MATSGLNGMARRLARLEVLVPAPPEQTEHEARVERVLTRLIETMDPEHAGALIRGLIARYEVMPEVKEGPRPLATIGLMLVGEHLDEPEPRFKLALPPALAGILLARSVWLFDRCVDCRLGLPFEAEHWRGNVYHPPVHHFDRCPDCGGAVEHDVYGFARVNRP